MESTLSCSLAGDEVVPPSLCERRVHGRAGAETLSISPMGLLASVARPPSDSLPLRYVLPTSPDSLFLLSLSPQASFNPASSPVVNAPALVITPNSRCLLQARQRGSPQPTLPSFQAFPTPFHHPNKLSLIASARA